MASKSSFKRSIGSLTGLCLVSLQVSPAERIGAWSLPQSLSGFSRTIPLLPQDFASVSGFQGQDIMGGAAIIFKRPKRLNDLAGAAAMMVVKRQPRSSGRPVEIARNTSPDNRKAGVRPGETEVASSATSDNDKAEAIKIQANAYYDQGQFALAVEAYKKALKYSPQDAVIYNNLGASYFSLARNSEAADAFEKSLELKANDADAYFNLGVAASAIGKHEEALEAFKQAVRLKPDWADAYNAMGDTYLNLGRYAEAAAAYEQTVRLQPDNSSAYSNLGYSYERIGKTSASLDALQKAVKLKLMMSPTTIWGQACIKPAVIRKRSRLLAMPFDLSLKTRKRLTISVLHIT